MSKGIDVSEMIRELCKSVLAFALVVGLAMGIMYLFDIDALTAFSMLTLIMLPVTIIAVAWLLIRLMKPSDGDSPE